MLMKNGEAVVGPQLLEGTRIALAPVSRVFAADIFREFTPAITAWMFPKSPAQLEETHAFIDLALRQWHAGTDLTFVIVDKSSQEFLGTCGLHGGGNPRQPEFGIWLKAGAHGKAFGREAIGTLRDWAAATLDVDSFIYPVDRRNLMSRKVAESLDGTLIGERRVRSMSGVDLELVVYRIPASRCT